MNTDPTNTPDKWTQYADRASGTVRIPGSPDPGVWVNAEFRTIPADDPRPILGYLLWHWHRELDGTWRWQGAGLGLHTLVSAEPLHLHPSIGCDATDGVAGGCPNHGWIHDGRWVPA